MKNLKIIIIFLLTLVVLESLFLFYLNKNVNELEIKLSNNKLESEKIISEQNNTISELRKQKYDLIFKNDELNEQLNDLNKNFKSLNEEFSIVKDEVTETTVKLEDYSEKIDSNMAWFKLNNNLENNDEFMSGIASRSNSIGLFIPQTIDKAIFFEDKSCIITTHGLNFVLYKWKFDYKDDTLTTKKDDYLKNLSRFILDKGGDCEDFSLFYKAMYNYLFNKCLKEGYSRDQIKINSFVSGTGIIRFEPERGDESWFISNSKEIEIEDSGNFMYVVCGTFYDSEDIFLKENSGHCVVAISSKNITKSTEVYSVLRESQLIEPQSGKYIGKLNNYLTSKINDDGIKPSGNYIWMVITDNDLYQYDEEKLSWVGYADFSNKIDEQLAILKSINR